MFLVEPGARRPGRYRSRFCIELQLAYVSSVRENPRSGWWLLKERETLMKRVLRASSFTLLLLFACGFAECYKPVTKNQLPARIHTVAVPAFQLESNALRYK